ncbi:MAG: hypothetical protein V3V10_05210 [Planctomycetota bacterium]
MSVPFWQPGTLYQPGEVVQPTTVNAVTQTAINNANFESGDVNWVKGANLVIGAAAAYEGTQALTYTPPAGADTSEATNDVRAAVSDGQLVNASCKVQIGDVETTCSIKLTWYNSGGTKISTSSGVTAVGPDATWRTLEVAGIAPAGAVTVSAELSIVATASAATATIFDAVTWDHFTQAVPNGFIYRSTQAASGHSGINEPVFPTTVGLTVVDNEVTWTTEEGNSVVWKAVPILQSDTSEPTFPAAADGTVVDNTILWEVSTLRVEDENCPNTKEVAILASKIFGAGGDIIPFSATVNPLDWTTPGDAGYIPFGLNTYGSQDVSALAIYRSNLVAFNGQAFQMWQVDEDPNNFAILDAIPIGCRFYKSLSPVSNDLVFLTDEGIRSMGIAGASTNLQAGFFGKQIDPLVLAAIKGGEVPNGLFFPGAGQYWLFFGEEAFVLTMNGGKADMSWSRYVFPSAIDDWTVQDGALYLRSGDKVWLVDDDTLVDDSGGADVAFVGKVWWPYLDFGALGVTKMMIGFDTVAEGTYSVSIGYNQKDDTQFTAPYTIVGDTLPGDVLPLPVSAPSLQFRLEFSGNQAWEWSASSFYLQDFRRTS